MGKDEIGPTGTSETSLRTDRADIVLVAIDEAGHACLDYCLCNGLTAGRVINNVSYIMGEAESADLILVLGNIETLAQHDARMPSVRALRIGIALDIDCSSQLDKYFQCQSDFDSIISLKHLANPGSVPYLHETAYLAIRAIIDPLSPYKPNLIGVDFADMRYIFAAQTQPRMGQVVHVAATGKAPVIKSCNELLSNYRQGLPLNIYPRVLHVQFCNEQSLENYKQANEAVTELFGHEMNAEVLVTLSDDERFPPDQSDLLLIMVRDQEIKYG